MDGKKELLLALERVVDMDIEREEEYIHRRLIKLGEELGEANEAYLSTTSISNGKNKSWEDFAEEIIDVLIVSLHMTSTKNPNEQSSSVDTLYANRAKVVNRKIDKWENNYHNSIIPTKEN